MWIPERWLSNDCIAAALGRPPRRAEIQLLRDRRLDHVLVRAHPAFPALLYLPIALGSVLYASLRGVTWGALALTFAAGWLVFSLAEYLIHRCLFHHPVGTTREARLDAFLTHGYHHTYQNDATRLVMPPLVSVPIAVVTSTLLLALFGRYGAAAFAGVLVGYVLYDSLHWAAHHVRAKRGPLAWLRRYHLLHHNDSRAARYGVSSPLWDLLLGTYLSPYLKPELRVGRQAP